MLAGSLTRARGTKVLEVGVGTGLLLPLYPRHCRVTGIDLSDGMLDEGARAGRAPRARPRRARADGREPHTFADDAFDVVVAAYVVTAVPDHRAVMNEIIRVARPGARVLLLNHFVNGSGLLAALERAVSPVCKYIGFRTDLSAGQVLDGLPLEVTRHTKVKPLKLWHLVECRNATPARAAR